ncbi:hypothetical protein [Yokenella regensburgei]|uniref:hypothetical protein n=1 Tax=Yokenella regensburgei TaxID=158877 RepID=UPI001375485A|nr:hypothetical protein [Yokenella regensburgei]KAF1366566.1 aminoglycoside phosphotransferase (APT) family kinase protein [Yokenella regensburgei]
MDMRFAGLPALALCLAACAGRASLPEKPETVRAGSSGTTMVVRAAPAAVTAAQTEKDALAQCRRALTALRVVSPADYARRQGEFTRLLRGASVYTRVRADVDREITDTMDALYRFRTRELCGRIRHDVSEGLVRQAGGIK